MKGTHIGELEELILLTVATLYDDAYGIAIMREIETRTARKITISTVHAALKRLEDKGFVTSRYDGATKARGGRRKHLFQVSKAGQKALAKSREIRNGLWETIPKIAFKDG
ncbi:MAG: PadR family transcriptional regulator [Cyclobacteriaceae bacterium]|nr:PadR family transcriptional regulator [Cyclobacteriaceae bacterium HetDA_MAG_MS6]